MIKFQSLKKKEREAQKRIIHTIGIESFSDKKALITFLQDHFFEVVFDVRTNPILLPPILMDSILQENGFFHINFTMHVETKQGYWRMSDSQFSKELKKNQYLPFFTEFMRKIALKKNIIMLGNEIRINEDNPRFYLSRYLNDILSDNFSILHYLSLVDTTSRPLPHETVERKMIVDRLLKPEPIPAPI